MITKRAVAVLLALVGPLVGADSSDVVLKAMRDELAHSRGLDAVNLEKPYFLSYTIEQGEAFGVSASLGALLASTDNLFRYPRIQVRVGDYQFDNTNYAGGAGSSSRYDIDRFPLENLYPVLRRYLWLATDQTYKTAVDSLARKRAALNSMSARDPIADFARAQPVQMIGELPLEEVDQAAWLARARALSAIFVDFPQVLGSNVEVQAVKNIRYLVN